MHWYGEVLQKYAVFNGRARRSEFWWFTLINAIVGAALGLIDTVIFGVNYGILSGLYYSEIHFIMGVSGGVIGFSAAAIGGLGNVYGAILGGLLFGMVQTLSAALIPRGSEFRDVVAFAVVMLFLIVRPSGILGEKSVERV